MDTMRCWLTLPTTFRPISHLHVLNAGAYDAGKRPPVCAFTPQRCPVAGCMLNWSKRCRPTWVPVYSLPTLHRPRSTCVSILTQPTAVCYTGGIETYRASTTMEQYASVGRLAAQLVAFDALVRTTRRVHGGCEVAGVKMKWGFRDSSAW